MAGVFRGSVEKNIHIHMQSGHLTLLHRSLCFHAILCKLPLRQEETGSRVDKASCEPQDCVAAEDLARLAVMEMGLV